MAKIPKVLIALRLKPETIEKVKRWADQLSASQADIVEQAVELFDGISSVPFKSDSPKPELRGMPSSGTKTVTMKVPQTIVRIGARSIRQKGDKTR